MSFVRWAVAGILALIEAEQREKRASLYRRCNQVMNPDEVARFPRLEPMLCNRRALHAGEHCGCESACDFDEHNEPCRCAEFTDFGLGRCECGGFKR